MSSLYVLIIEDDDPLRKMLQTTLVAHGYRVGGAETAADGLREARTRTPDIILLDLGLPDGDGITLTGALRQFTRAPIIVLSARDREHDKVASLDAGADDYVTKPFSTAELLARMRVAARHALRGDGAGADAVMESHGVRFDRSRRQVFVGEGEVHLTRTEYKLLETLARHAGMVVTHRQLLNEVWGPGATYQTHYLRVYVAQLRQKLEADPAQPKLLLTEPGVGYRLRVSASSAGAES